MLPESWPDIVLSGTQAWLLAGDRVLAQPVTALAALATGLPDRRPARTLPFPVKLAQPAAPGATDDPDRFPGVWSQNLRR